MTRTEQTLMTEVTAALEDLRSQFTDGQPRHDPAGVLIGTVPDFSERLLAWAWVIRAAHEHYGLPTPPAELLYRATLGAVNDEEMSEELGHCQDLFHAQDSGGPEAVESALSEFDSDVTQVAAMGIMILGAREAVREASTRHKVPPEKVVETLGLLASSRASAAASAGH